MVGNTIQTVNSPMYDTYMSTPSNSYLKNDFYFADTSHRTSIEPFLPSQGGRAALYPHHRNREFLRQKLARFPQVGKPFQTLQRTSQTCSGHPCAQ